jgi:hypothetical protein
MQQVAVGSRHYGLNILSVNAAVATKSEDTLTATERDLRAANTSLVVANLAIESTQESDLNRLEKLETMLGNVATIKPDTYIAMLYPEIVQSEGEIPLAPAFIQQQSLVS